MTLNFPEYALKCLNIIENASFEAYFVGGCVRDGILGRPSSDIDITTNALPEEIMSLFEHTVPTGIKHGTVTVIIDSRSIEVTTYRTEGTYGDSRHPDSVNFVSDIKYDLSRRDFTVNALAYNPSSGLIDLFGGLEDIKIKQIRSVGDPFERFGEDALRILRAFRFSSVLGFEIESNTLTAAFRLSHLIGNISGERVLEELSKLASGTNPYVVSEFVNRSFLSCFGINRTVQQENIFKRLAHCKTDKNKKTALLISLFEHNTSVIKEKLKPNNKLYKYISFLDCFKQVTIPSSTLELKQLLNKHSAELTELYILYISLLDPAKASGIPKMLCEIEDNREPYKISDLKINGQDLTRLGFSGSDIGIMLNRALNHAMEFPEDNKKDKLLKIIKN